MYTVSGTTISLILLKHHLWSSKSVKWNPDFQISAGLGMADTMSFSPLRDFSIHSISRRRPQNMPCWQCLLHLAAKVVSETVTPWIPQLCTSWDHINTGSRIHHEGKKKIFLHHLKCNIELHSAFNARKLHAEWASWSPYTLQKCPTKSIRMQVQTATFCLKT